MNLDKNTLKIVFKRYMLDNIKRDGVTALLDYLDSTDFFRAPASSKFHMACPGGLVFHSIKVYENLMQLSEMKTLRMYNKETIAIVGLLHDVCKVNYYIEDTRNKKDPVTGQWSAVPFYNTDDSFPYGHGEKSVYLVSKYLKLTDEEAMAMRWHMSGWDSSSRGGEGAINSAFEKYPLCSLVAAADLMATYLDETRE